MKISGDTRNAAQAWATENPGLYTFLRGITVEFYGATGGPVRDRGTFHATGVVVRRAGGGVDIVTAKHNFWIAAGKDAKDAEVQPYFLANIKARIYTAPKVYVEAPVVSIKLPDNINRNANFDVAVVRVTQASFVDVVTALVADGAAGRPYLPPQDPDEGWIVRPASATTAAAVLTNGNPPYVAAVPAAANFDLVHMGFGNYQALLFGFEFRVLPAADLVAPTLIPRTHDGWINVFTYGASPTETGAEGDSGGPIFAVAPAEVLPDGKAGPKQARRVLLVGVHSGANFFADAEVEKKAKDNSNNVMTLVVPANLD